MTTKLSSASDRIALHDFLNCYDDEVREMAVDDLTGIFNPVSETNNLDKVLGLGNVMHAKRLGLLC